MPSKAPAFPSTPTASSPRALPCSGSNTEAPFEKCVQGSTGSLNHSQGSNLPPEMSPCPLGLAEQEGLPSVALSRLAPHPCPGQDTENPSSCLYPLRNLTRLRFSPAPHSVPDLRTSLTTLNPETKLKSPQQPGRASPAPLLRPKHCAVLGRETWTK